MTIKSQGGIFGRNPTFNNVEVDGTLTVGGNSVPDASTILVDGDIGSTVQGYDADTAKTDAANIFTADQTISTSNTLTYFNIINTAESGNRYSAISLKDSSTQNALFYQNHNDGNVLLRNDTVGGGIGLYTQTATYGATLLADGNFSITDGNLQLASGKGIDFSATAGTGTSELFSDYEEGNWTPVVRVGSDTGTIVTTTTTSAKYTKVGRLVRLEGYITRTDATAHSGQIVMTGMPFTGYSNGIQIGGGAWFDNAPATDIRSFTYTNTTSILFPQTGTTDNFVNVQDWENNRYIYFSINYMT